MPEAESIYSTMDRPMMPNEPMITEFQEPHADAYMASNFSALLDCPMLTSKALAPETPIRRFKPRAGSICSVKSFCHHLGTSHDFDCWEAHSSHVCYCHERDCMMCHAHYFCTHDAAGGNICHFCRTEPIDTNLPELDQMLSQPGEEGNDAEVLPTQSVTQAPPEGTWLPLSEEHTEYLLNLLPTDFDFAWLDDKAPYENFSKRYKKRLPKACRAVNDLDSYVINPNKRKPGDSRRAWRKALGRIDLQNTLGLDDDAAGDKTEDDDQSDLSNSHRHSAEHVENEHCEEADVDEEICPYVEATESNPDGWIQTPGGPIDRRPERLLVKTVSARSYSRVVDGRKRWFTYDGRPLNSAGRPTYTEEEKRAFVGGRFSNVQASWDSLPNTDLDSEGRPYFTEITF